MMKRGRTATVLLIDGDATGRRACRRLLEANGLEVLEAADGAAGLSLARERAPDVVVTELVLPGLDGETLMAQLRERLHGTRVIAITPEGDDGARDVAVGTGCTAVVARPLEPAALLREVLRVVR